MKDNNDPGTWEYLVLRICLHKQFGLTFAYRPANVYFLTTVISQSLPYFENIFIKKRI
jgi:hypothetical protein